MAVYGFNDTKDKVDIVDKESIKEEQGRMIEAWNSLYEAANGLYDVVNRLNGGGGAYDEHTDAAIKNSQNAMAESHDAYKKALAEYEKW